MMTGQKTKSNIRNPRKVDFCSHRGILQLHFCSISWVPLAIHWFGQFQKLLAITPRSWGSKLDVILRFAFKRTAVIGVDLLNASKMGTEYVMPIEKQWIAWAKVLPFQHMFIIVWSSACLRSFVIHKLPFVWWMHFGRWEVICHRWW